jgi:HPt (histidine-containing phosphotransfer) domain-containing protein
MKLQNYVPARLEAHTIKGIAANISAEPLRAAALLLEKELGTGDPHPSDRLLTDVAARIEELIAVL